MKNLSVKTRVYILSTLAAGAFILFYYGAVLDFEKMWLPVTLLSLLGSLSLLFKVDGATKRTHYNITFLIFGFSLVYYGAGVTVIVILISHLIEWAWHKYSWYIQLFNLSSLVIVAAGAHAMLLLVNQTQTLNTWQAALSMLTAMIVFTILNHLMVGIIVWLARGENFSQSGIFDFFSLAMDCVLLSMGAAAAVIWSFNPFAILLMLLPLYLIYSTLRVPELERKTETDQKTGVANHHYFETCLESELRRAERFDHPLTIVMADLDLLRNINNSYGHLAGDEVLIGVAKILQAYSRDYDIVARFGGEEFTVLMPETTPEQAYPIVEKIRQIIASTPFTVPTSITTINATMSFGIACREPGLAGKDIINNADMALYHAKLKGRNLAFIYAKDGYDSLFQPDEIPAQSPEKPADAPSVLARQEQVKLPAAQACEQKPSADQAALPGVNESRKKPVTAARRQKHNRANLYITALSLAAYSLFAILAWGATTVDWTGLLVFTLMVAATEWASIDIYVRNTAVSVSAVPFIAGVVMFGPLGTLVMSVTLAAVALLRHNSPISRFIFNSSNQLLAGMACIGLFRLSGSAYTSWAIPVQILASPLTGLVVFLITSVSVSAGMHLSLQGSFRQVWKDQFSWLAPYYLGIGLIAYTLIFSYQTNGILGTGVILVPLLLLRISQKQFIGRTKDAVQELKSKNQILEAHSKEITRLNNGLLDTLAEVIDLRDPYVLGHSRQVTYYAVSIAQKLGLPSSQIEVIRKSSLMHDVGKLGIHQRILAKPASLTPEEYETVKRHVTVGAELLRKSQALQSLIPIVLHHHERFDGMGYPGQQKGEEISLEARIVCLADALDAMASDRPYRRAMSFAQICEEVDRCSGSQFDPAIVQAFQQIAREQGDAYINNSAVASANFGQDGILLQFPASAQKHPA